jgi:hypothetical protein
MIKDKRPQMTVVEMIEQATHLCIERIKDLDPEQPETANRVAIEQVRATFTVARVLGEICERLEYIAYGLDDINEKLANQKETVQ